MSRRTLKRSGRRSKRRWRAGRRARSPNRGRDIAPKLITFRDVYDSHPIVLHLHTKKSPHDSFLRLWRYLVYETLLGSPRVVSGILSAFAQEPRLGIVAAEHFFPSRGGIQWGDNFAAAAQLAGRMGVSLDPRAPLDFPAGSMFWARSAALAPLLALDLSPEDFPPEEGQTDGTLAHAVERLYFHACELAGMSWMKICRPELLYVFDPPLAQIAGDEDLRRLISRSRPLVRPNDRRRRTAGAGG
jgi:lipopolysaccharide biosynthesis protein